MTGYGKEGNILTLIRLVAVSAIEYGVIDSLSMSYDGNQLQSISDQATDSVFGKGFEFKDGSDLEIEYFYDSNGNLTKDLDKKIAEIEYNFLNLPHSIQFENGDSISYVYSGDGTKLRTTHVIKGITTTTDYCGNAIYENGVAKLLLTERGYITLSDTVYHYFLQDHQGNNRVVVDQNGTVEEVNHYYPFGGVFAHGGDVQPYKYNGKELDRENGLDWYDYGARMYDPMLNQWSSMDPSCEKYYGLSPYIYCKNNPVLRIDPDGKDDYRINETGRLFREPIKGSTYDRLMLLNREDISIVVNDKSLLLGMYDMQRAHKNTGREYYNLTANLEDAAAVFKFGADNTKVEWKLDIYDDQGSKTAVVGTSAKENSVFSDVQDELNVQGNKIVDLHSHPNNDHASSNDMSILKIKTGAIYYKNDKELFFYNSKIPQIKNEIYKINTSEELLKKLKEKFMK